jgi:dihydroxyacid dehydratase/phosphogluconate dehydratase
MAKSPINIPENSSVITSPLAGATKVAFKENLKDVKSNTNQRVAHPVSNPISGMGGVVGLKGLPAPEGAIVMVAEMKTPTLKGLARCVDREQDAFVAVEAGKIKSGNMISNEAAQGTLDIDAPKIELEQRRKASMAPNNPYTTGALRKYADQMGPAVTGAVTHAGGKAERVCFADI